MFTLMVSTEKLKIYLMTFSLSTIRPSKLSRSTLDSWFIEKTSFNTSVTECIGHGSKFLSIFIWKFYFVFIRSIENCGSYDKDYKLNRYYFDEKKKVGLSATFFQKWKKNIRSIFPISVGVSGHYAMKRNKTSQNFKIIFANVPYCKFYRVCGTHPNQIIGPIAFF